MLNARWRKQSIFIILSTIFLCYCNSFKSSWHFDDFQNIVTNEKLHLSSLNSASLSQVFIAHPRENSLSFRPIAYLSFALNWYFGGDNTFGYHLVNIALHAATALLLYLFLLNLLTLPNLRPRSFQARHWIALVATLLWALNPIQTQAVTYIVQRMAVLATFFFLAALYFYLRGRTAQLRNDQLKWYTGTLLCFVLSLGAKENSVTLPVVLVLIEWVFLNSLTMLTKRHLFLFMILLSVCVGAAFLLTNGNPLANITSGYAHRSFTLEQRLLTEGRVVVFYLSLLLLPLPSRLSLDHDFSLSTSLFHPPTTVLAIIFLTGLTMWALWKRRTWPVSAFALLFFLLNQIVESSLLPLEIIFEHRNYLPSLFLFLPFSVALVDLHQSAQLHNKSMARHGLAIMTVLLLGLLAFGTYTRNTDWQTEVSLWQDSLNKAPGQSRPYINLAYSYHQSGEDEVAFTLYQKSLTKISATPEKDRMRAYNGMGNIAMDRGRPSEAVFFYRQALQASANESSRYSLHKALLAAGFPQEAERELLMLLDKHPDDYELQTSLALVMTSEHNYAKAAAELQKIITKAPTKYERGAATLCLGSIFSYQGKHQEAEQQFRTALSLLDPLQPLLCVIGDLLRQGKKEVAADQLKKLLIYFSAQRVSEAIKRSALENVLYPIAASALLDFINETTTATKNPAFSKKQ